MKTKLGYIIPTIIVLLTGLGYLWFSSVIYDESSSVSDAKTEVGNDYYVTLTLVELKEKKEDGSEWDSLNDSAPDIYFEIYWRGLRVHKSTVKDDSLIGKWSNAEVDIREMALKGESASVDGLIQAARINVQENEELEFRVYDYDPLGSSDLAGTFKINVTDLEIGDTTVEPSTNSIKRLVLRVIDMHNPPPMAK